MMITMNAAADAVRRCRPTSRLVAAFCLGIVAVDVPHAVTSKVLVTPFHLVNCPTQRNAARFGSVMIGVARCGMSA